MPDPTPTPTLTPIYCPGFNEPRGIAVDCYGHLYVADSKNHKIKIISPNGAVYTFAGTGIAGHTDGHRSIATFDTPIGLAFDKDGVLLYIIENNNTIRTLNIIDDSVSTLTVVNSLVPCSNVITNLPTANFGIPSCVAVDSKFNLYIADLQCDIIKVIDFNNNTVSVYAGDINNSNTKIDGPALQAGFSNPESIAFDIEDNMYVADTGNNCIRRIDRITRDVTTYAGTGNYGHSNGPRLSARFSRPTGVAVDFNGDIYVADTENHRIKKISKTTDQVSTYAGIYLAGLQNGNASNAKFNNPRNLLIKGRELYISDSSNHSIRIVDIF